MPLDLAQARDLLLRVVNKFYAERHSPLPGAFVKAQLLVEATIWRKTRAVGFTSKSMAIESDSNTAM